jgi:predicted dienelactone hydrolase
VRSYAEVLVDDSRDTAANGSYPGAPGRRLKLTVWHPATAAAGPYPLLVYSHGFSSRRSEGAYLAEHLASHGYLVVAADYPLTHMTAPGGPRVQDVVNQAADVSFLIDQLLARGERPDHALAGMPDPDRVGALGLSLGGLTTTLVTFHPQLRDPRIKAAIAIAGPTSVLTADFFGSADIPFLMLAGDIDALVPHRANAAPIPDKVPGGELVTISGASHTGFARIAALLRWLDNPDAVGCQIVRRNLGDALEEPWFNLLGTPEQGIDHNVQLDLCTMDPLPRAINVLRQQMIATVVVRSFFDREFSPSPAQRRAADRYLREQLANELPEVTYRRGH